MAELTDPMMNIGLARLHIAVSRSACAGVKLLSLNKRDDIRAPLGVPEMELIKNIGIADLGRNEHRFRFMLLFREKSNKPVLNSIPEPTKKGKSAGKTASFQSVRPVLAACIASLEYITRNMHSKIKRSERTLLTIKNASLGTHVIIFMRVRGRKAYSLQHQQPTRKIRDSRDA